MEKKRKPFKKPFKNKKNNNKRKKPGDESDEGFEEVSRDLTIGRDSLTFQDDVAEMGMDSDSELTDTRKLVRQQNRKNKKSGGFQSMGLSHHVYKGILKRGYKIPTPIQRKCIPLLMEGRDLVAMARTGSGKTAAFLIPMFEKLQVHSAQAGARAIILSPTRELAVQTLKFTKEIGKYTGLKAAVILGGDKIEDQFAALHENPDIIIATPGRFMHVLVEMELKLSAVEYVVFDEADRLFEMGFHEQLTEIVGRIPDSRQTLLFSATLPKLLVEFAKAGLHDPTLIRLDVDTKLSPQLTLSFLQVRHEDRLAALLHLLRNVVKPSGQTVVFAATKHHVEYLSMVLREAGITCSYSYSALDPTARKIHVAKFRNKATKVLIVTDLAARGIDIPMLDYVINYNFPAKPKLFVHRVGRVARAGRSGSAFSLVSPDEMPFVLDLHLFLGRSLKMVTSNTQKDEDGLNGRVPQSVLDDEDENLRVWTQRTDLVSMKRTIDNAYKQYIRSRPAPSAESVKRYKAMLNDHVGYHPMFAQSSSYSPDLEESKNALLEKMRNYKPQSTIFEIHATKKGTSSDIMRKKRDKHGNKIAERRAAAVQRTQSAATETEVLRITGSQPQSSEADIEEAFSHVVAPNYHPLKETKKQRQKGLKIVDEENYLSHRPKDGHSEKGLSLGTSFDLEAANLTLDLAGDDQKQTRNIKNAVKWDRKKKKFVQQETEGKKKKVKTESGQWVSASYKKNLYKDWLTKAKVSSKPSAPDSDDSDHEDGPARKKARTEPREGRFQVYGEAKPRGKGHYQTKPKADPADSASRKPRRREIKSRDQILKQRRKHAKMQNFQKFRNQKRQSNGPGGGQGGKRRK